MISTLSALKNSKFISLMGQSNANGYQTPPDVNTYLPQPGQYIFENVSQTWQRLQQNFNNGGAYHDYTGSVGMEMTLMQMLKEHYGADQFMFKFAEGGTSLGHADTGYDWQPGETNDYMFNGAVDMFTTAVRTFPAQMPQMKVLIWVQGENDTDATNANNYLTNLKTFINALKVAWNLPNMKVLQTLLADTQTVYDTTNKTIVNQAKIDFSVNGNKYVNIDGADCPGGVHFSAAGQAYIAVKVFDTLITML